MSKPTEQEQIDGLHRRGYAIFERAYDDAEMDRLAATMHQLHSAAGRPRCFSPEPLRIEPEIEVCPTGLVFYKFIKRCPEYADFVVRPEVVAAIRGYLGADMELELTGAVIADAHRPFFPWHTHIGGIDDGKYRREGIWPHFDAPERVMTLLYVDDIGEDNGPLLIHPRAVNDPTPPPHDPDALDWPNQVVATVPRGTVVIMDQCTWHAVRPKRTAGIRSFVGCYYRTSRAPVTEWVDESLRGFRGGGELLRSVLPRGLGGRRLREKPAEKRAPSRLLHRAHRVPHALFHDEDRAGGARHRLLAGPLGVHGFVRGCGGLAEAVGHHEHLAALFVERHGVERARESRDHVVHGVANVERPVVTSVHHAEQMVVPEEERAGVIGQDGSTTLEDEVAAQHGRGDVAHRRREQQFVRPCVAMEEIGQHEAHRADRRVRSDGEVFLRVERRLPELAPGRVDRLEIGRALGRRHHRGQQHESSPGERLRCCHRPTDCASSSRCSSAKRRWRSSTSSPVMRG